MKRRTALLILALVLIVAAPVIAQVMLPPPVIHESYQLMGFSAMQVPGDAGIRGMLDACHREFPSSRMCTSQEILETEYLFPIATTESAWVRPVIVESSGDASASDEFRGLLDASGVMSRGRISDGSLSCRGWSSTGGYGLTVSPEGAFRGWPSAVGVGQDCNVARPVACCTLVQVPEPSAAVGFGAGAAGLAALSRWKASRN